MDGCGYNFENELRLVGACVDRLGGSLDLSITHLVKVWAEEAATLMRFRVKPINYNSRHVCDPWNPFQNGMI